LAAVAARTDRIRLGPAVAVLPFRHPLQVVEDYAMVDQLSGGRLVLGVGSGSEASEFRGFDLDPAAKRAAFDDRLPVVEAAFTGRTSDDGAPAPVAGARADAPPIYLAATSPAGARAAGIGGFGLLTLASPGTPSIDEVTARVEAYRAGQHRRQRAARTDGVIVTVLCHLADDDARARREAAPALERFLRAHGGADDDGFAVYDGMVARGVGAFGTPETVAETLEPLAVAGVDHFCLWMGFGDLDRDLFSRSMELAPRLRELLTGHRWADAATTA
ncbi:MAG: LLM class flavin-dependent oxidoreductase, partial [Acidobacteriota bacterium]